MYIYMYICIYIYVCIYIYIYVYMYIYYLINLTMHNLVSNLSFYFIDTQPFQAFIFFSDQVGRCR